MRKRNIYIKTALAAFTVILSACSSDNDALDNSTSNQDKPVSNKAMTFRASMDGTTTRTDFNGNSTTWSDNDAISILNTASVPEESDRENQADFTISEGVGTKEATFTGGPIKANGNDNDQFYAFYPANDQNFTNTNGTVKMTATIPTVQKAIAGTYDQSLHFMSAYSTNSTFAFKNVCALLKITLTNNSSVCRIKVVANPTLTSPDARDFGYTSIAGNFDATVSSSDGTATVTATEQEKTYVELRADGDDGTATKLLGNGTFYLVVLPTDLPNGFTVIMEKQNGRLYQRVNSKIDKFERNKIYDLGSYSISTTISNFTTLENAVDLDLPSGTLWAVRNINKSGSLVTNEYDNADYFSWGKEEVVRASSYSVPTLTNNTLRTSADYAYSTQTSNRYCMPIYAQMYELYSHFPNDKKNSFKRTWTNGNSHNGAEFTADTGRTLWLPYSGYYTYTGILWADRTQENSQGRYWSRTYASNQKTYCLELQQQSISGNTEPVTISWSDNSEYGYSIRGVAVNEKIAPIYQ